MFSFSDREPFAAKYKDMETLKDNLALEEIEPGRDKILRFTFLKIEAGEAREQYTIYTNQKNLLEVALVEEIESENFKKLLEQI